MGEPRAGAALSPQHSWEHPGGRRRDRAAGCGQTSAARWGSSCQERTGRDERRTSPRSPGARDCSREEPTRQEKDTSAAVSGGSAATEGEGVSPTRSSPPAPGSPSRTHRGAPGSLCVRTGAAPVSPSRRLRPAFPAGCSERRARASPVPRARGAAAPRSPPRNVPGPPRCVYTE
ncbi:serine/arginine repetitive matrix protein 1-like isoform X2 [Serinus canaria]|uniref:serine/arginine repetitive matrix protein 1-like isoform X2 n=1 Tax=Serinus canaria TaxID=9135 RepID=UPI0021CCC60A|nr:serine/arginine repetitive matrix protein 1-like isoform X2 [Serinus canaria]